MLLKPQWIKDTGLKFSQVKQEVYISGPWEWSVKKHVIINLPLINVIQMKEQRIASFSKIGIIVQSEIRLVVNSYQLQNV